MDLFVAFGPNYDLACRLAEDGDLAEAEATLMELRDLYPDGTKRAVLENDLGVLEMLAGRDVEAISRFQAAREFDPSCELVQFNRDWACSREVGRHLNESVRRCSTYPQSDSSVRKVRIAILSVLFNWPSTGGGTIHTAETGHFLEKCGYEVHHLYAKFPEWGLGLVTEPPLLRSSEAIEFEPAGWSRDQIISRFREKVNEFRPDYVIITDSWNFKPLLAEAAQGYKYFLRLAAQECLCPLNNVRLLVDEQGRPTNCPKQQLATPKDCVRCVQSNEKFSGWLHLNERALAGFGTEEYDHRLRKAFAEAEAVLVVNPLIAAHVAPFAKAVRVVPSGFNAMRFPKPEINNGGIGKPKGLFFAGLINEYMKGFHVLFEACDELWRHRQDFEIIVTANPTDGPQAPFLRYIGWQSQTDLPIRMRDAAIVVFPTIAEEALGRSAVEAMGVGLPVIASRIGGLPFTVTDEVTGLLFEPADSADLMSKIVRLLNSDALCQSLGRAGREKFEREFTWEVILERHYQPMFGPPMVAVSSNRTSSDLN